MPSRINADRTPRIQKPNNTKHWGDVNDCAPKFERAREVLEEKKGWLLRLAAQ
jgi:hypothetical protein